MVSRCACAACLAVRRRGWLLRFAHLPACPKLYAQPCAHFVPDNHTHLTTHNASLPASWRPGGGGIAAGAGGAAGPACHLPASGRGCGCFSAAVLICTAWIMHASCRPCTPSFSTWTRVRLLRCCFVSCHARVAGIVGWTAVASGRWRAWRACSLLGLWPCSPRLSFLHSSHISACAATWPGSLQQTAMHPSPLLPHRQVGHPNSRGAAGGAAAAGQVGHRRERRGAHMRGLAGHLVMGLLLCGHRLGAVPCQIELKT